MVRVATESGGRDHTQCTHSSEKILDSKTGSSWGQGLQDLRHKKGKAGSHAIDIKLLVASLTSGTNAIHHIVFTTFAMYQKTFFIIVRYMVELGV